MITSDLLKPILRKQKSQQDYLPKIGRHIDEHIVHFEDGRMGFAIRLDGIPFEGVDDSHLMSAFTTLKNLLITVGKQHGNRLGLWTTFQRRKIEMKRDYHFNTTFSRKFAEHYLQQFDKGNYYENLFYISVVLKYNDFDDGLEDAKDLLVIMLKALDFYDPHPLGTYENENGVVFSEYYQFWGMLMNGGYREHLPLTSSPAYTMISSSSHHFGTDVLEIRNPERSKFATCYDLQDYGKSKVLVLKNMLEIQCEFTLTQSFIYIENSTMQTEINKQEGALEGAMDLATDQHDELAVGKGELAAGRMLFGDYSASLVVYGDTPKQARQNGSSVFTEFLTSGGFRFAPSGLASPSSFLSQFPGYWLRPRIMPKTTTNLATTFGMHNYSQGKSWGNPIGDGSPLIPLKTVSNTLFNFSMHYSKRDEYNTGEKTAGHTLIIGATGTGKSTLEAVLLSFLERWNPYMFLLDLDRGMEIFVRVQGGTYFALEEGVPSGLNPFQLPDYPANRMFLYGLVKTCAGGATAEEEKQIKTAVDTLYDIDFAHRNFSVLLQNLPYSTDGNSLRTRLSKWCRSENGQFAWCLDNDQNKFDPDSFYRIGLDLTCILKKNYQPTEPVLAYLFYLKDLMAERVAAESGILASVIAEFWYAARFASTSELMLKVLKTGRKLGECMILDTQSPEDAIECENFPAIIQQTPTKIFLPNPSAGYEGSYERCGLTEKEFLELKDLNPRSRTFLIKQGNQSAFAKLDLKGFDDELAVLSGSSDNVILLHRVIAEVGSEDPDIWYEPFVEAVRQREEEKRCPKTSPSDRAV